MNFRGKRLLKLEGLMLQPVGLLFKLKLIYQKLRQKSSAYCNCLENKLWIVRIGQIGESGKKAERESVWVEGGEKGGGKQRGKS